MEDSSSTRRTVRSLSTQHAQGSIAIQGVVNVAQVKQGYKLLVGQGEQKFPQWLRRRQCMEPRSTAAHRYAW